MKKSYLSYAIGMALGGLGINTNAALSTSTLSFTLGTPQTLACNYGTPLPCALNAYNVTDIVGSYFSMDTGGNGTEEPGEKTPIASFRGIQIGTAQTASGSHAGNIDETESPNIDQPWTFFGATGMHLTKSPIIATPVIAGHATLDMSGWSWTWNGIPLIPLVQQGPAIINCNSPSCTVASEYTLDAAFHVAGAGFTTVGYTLHLEGTVEPVTPPDINLNIDGGGIHECDATGGKEITVSAEVLASDPGDIASITWFLDDQIAGQGATTGIFVPLGKHTVKVEVTMATGNGVSTQKSVLIEDTVAPVITAGFVDSRTGAEVTEIKDKKTVQVTYTVDDVCDPSPAISANAGVPVAIGDSLSARTSRKDSTVDLIINKDSDSVELSVMAEDSSGNISGAKSRLTIIP